MGKSSHKTLSDTLYPTCIALDYSNNQTVKLFTLGMAVTPGSEQLGRTKPASAGGLRAGNSQTGCHVGLGSDLQAV